MNTCLQKTEQQQKIQLIQDTLRGILLFFVGFFCLVFVALIILNMASAIDVDADLGLFFGFQTTTIDEYQENNIQPNINALELGKMSKLQINSEVKMGIDNIVSTADWSNPEEVDLKDGSLTIVEEVLPTGEWPLCIDQAWLDSYYVVAYSYGGYEPVTGMSYIKITQGNEWWNFDDKLKEFYIDVTWTKIIGESQYTKVCCADEWYRGTFTIDLDKLCFDAENYPVDGVPAENWAKWWCSTEIPGKDVFWYFNTTWSGCHEEDQYFSIMSIREKYQFPKY